jgi:uncharacterized membrane protein YfcA
MSKNGTRRLIAIMVTVSYILITGYCIYAGKDVPSVFSTITGSVIGYYFGKSTALEIPHDN